MKEKIDLFDLMVCHASLTSTVIEAERAIEAKKDGMEVSHSNTEQMVSCTMEMLEEHLRVNLEVKDKIGDYLWEKDEEILEELGKESLELSRRMYIEMSRKYRKYDDKRRHDKELGIVAKRKKVTLVPIGHIPT